VRMLGGERESVQELTTREFAVQAISAAGVSGNASSCSVPAQSSVPSCHPRLQW